MSEQVYFDPEASLHISKYCGPEANLEMSRTRQRWQLTADGDRLLTLTVEQMESLEFFFENTGSFETHKQ